VLYDDASNVGRLGADDALAVVLVDVEAEASEQGELGDESRGFVFAPAALGETLRGFAVLAMVVHVSWFLLAV